MMSSQSRISFLERQALKWFRGVEAPAGHPSFVTRRELRKRLRNQERTVILRAAMAGALSGIVAAGGMYAAEPFAVPEGAVVPWTAKLPLLVISVGISTAAAIAELLYLYYDGVRTAGRINTVTLSCNRSESIDETQLALVRAGLAMPPFSEPFLTIDPLTEKSRLKLQLWSLLYKTKISASSFVSKATVRQIGLRITGRALGRAAIELAAVPVFAVWNAYITRKIIVQVRLRALGPRLVDEVMNEVFPEGFDALHPTVQRAFFGAIREQVISVGFFNSTLLLLLATLRPHLERLNLANGPSGLADALPDLPPIDARRVVEFVALLAAFDGTNDIAERKTLKRLQRALGLDPNPERIDAYCTMVLEGLPLVDVAQGALSPAPTSTIAEGLTATPHVTEPTDDSRQNLPTGGLTAPEQ